VGPCCRCRTRTHEREPHLRVCVTGQILMMQFDELVPEMAREVSQKAPFWAELQLITSSTPSLWTTSKKKQSTDSRWAILSSSLRTLRPERLSLPNTLSRSPRNT